MCRASSGTDTIGKARAKELNAVIMEVIGKFEIAFGVWLGQRE